LTSAFTPTQRDYLKKLPEQFRWSEALEFVPRATLSRLLDRAKSLGIVNEREGVYRKTSGTCGRLELDH
jgi:hypothetical protein